MELLLIGLSHKTAPVEIRERLDFSPNVLRSVLTHFDTNHTKAHLQDVREGVILSTCNRVEVYALVANPDIARKSIIKLLSRASGIPPERFSNYLYIQHDEQAAQHLLRVSCGLDSMVLGEPQILGQITESYEAALSQGAAGTVVSALFRAAIHTGKRARTETRIGYNSLSISSVAAGLAQNLLGDLSSRNVLLIGAGEMGTVAVRALMKRGVTDVTVVNRTFKNAEQLAAEWSGKAMAFQQLPEALTQADIAITCTGAPHTILDRKQVEPALVTRPNRPLFLIDIAVPRDINADVTDLPNVYLHDIDDLQSQAEENVRERQAEIPLVEAIVNHELAHFLDWYASLDVVSTITHLRGQMEELRQMELQRLFNRLDLNEREQELVATMSHRLVNKILHEPTRRLKKEAASGNSATYVSALHHLFDLDTAKNGTHRNGED